MLTLDDDGENDVTGMSTLVTVTVFDADVVPSVAVILKVALELEILVIVKVFPDPSASPEPVKSQFMISGFENPVAVHVAGRLFIVMLDGPLILAIRIHSSVWLWRSDPPEHH